MAFDRFDIVAKLPPGAAQGDTPKLLQALLTDRFKLVVEMETKPLPAFLLALGKGPIKLKAAADLGGPTGCEYHPSAAAAATPNTPPPPTITLKCTNMTMERFADQLRNESWPPLDHPVVDLTGLKGAWDFDFLYSWQPSSPDAITRSAALEKLGLKLDLGTAPRPALTIASMAETPTPNVAGIETLLPPPPLPAFDVTVVRPSKSERKDIQSRVNGSQFTIAATQLRLMAYAWSVSVTTVVNGPAFLDDHVWEVTGKIPTPDTPAKADRQQQFDSDLVRLMMRTALADRFGLKAHLEERPGMAYTLYPGTPKMKIANPANRASCTDRPASGEKDPSKANPYLTEYFHCENVTLDQFARELQANSGYIIKTPVVNRTGIEGRFDLTLTFTGIHTLEMLGIVPNANGFTPPAAGSEGVGTGSGPVGVPVMLIDAVAKQLGLKLVLEKRPINALVVDHIEEEPTEKLRAPRFLAGATRLASGSSHWG